MDLNTESGVLVDLNLFEIVSDKAPGAGTFQAGEIEGEIRRIVKTQSQRAHQSSHTQVEVLHHPLPETLSTRRSLNLVDAYFQVGRGVLWKYNLEVLATTVHGQTRTSLEWIGAVAVWRQMMPDTRDLIRRSISDVQLALNWEKARIAYTVDPGLHRALRDTGPGSEIPPGILRQLPHPDPVFLLPRGIPVTVADGTRGMVRAFFLRGLIDHQYSTSTDSPEASHYQICVLTSLEDAYGAIVDWDLSGVSIPLDQSFTVESVSKFSTAAWDSRENEHSALSQIQSWVQEMLHICLPVVLYCCSINADRRVQPSPKKQSKAKRSKNAAPPTPVYELGYRVGPVLAASSTRQNAAVRAASGITGTRRPHIRRAHWHTYWYGPRDDCSPRLKWVAATFIHPEGDPITTVVPVRRV